MTKYTIANYEEHAIDYLDGTMTPSERRDFQKFLDAYPDVRIDIEQMEGVRLPHYQISFPSKDKLLKPVATRSRATVFYLHRIAAAILLLFLISVIWVNREKAVQELATSETFVPHSPKEIMELEEATIVPTEEKNVKKAQLATAERMQRVNNRNKPEPLTKNEALFTDESVDGRPENPVIQEDLPYTDDREEMKTSLVEAIEFTVIYIDHLELKPVIAYRPELKISENLNATMEEMEKDGRFSIGKLLAKANLIPTGLSEEIAAGGLREKIIPESYSDTK